VSTPARLPRRGPRLSPLWSAATCRSFRKLNSLQEAASSCRGPKRRQAAALQREARFKTDPLPFFWHWFISLVRASVARKSREQNRRRRRLTNTEPGAVAPGSRYDTHNRRTRTEICNQPHPVATAPGSVFVRPYIEQHYFTRAKLMNQYSLLMCLPLLKRKCYKPVPS